MIIDDLSCSSIVLEVSVLDIDGSSKTNISSATVRVYHISGVEIEDLAPVSLSQVGITNIWRYIWNSPGLGVGHYIAEYTLIDTDNISGVFTEDIIIDNISGEVWSESIRALTDKSDFTISGVKTTLDALNDLSSSDVETACDASLLSYDSPTNAELEALFDSIKGIGWSTETLVSLQNVVDNIKLKTDIIPADPATNTYIDTLPASIWGYINRTLTDLGLSASDIWAYEDRTLTEGVSATVVVGLDDVITELTSVNTNLEDIHDRIKLTTPIHIASLLLAEYYQNLDLDNDSLIYGKDFYISANRPKILDNLPKKGIAKTWETYLAEHPELTA